MAEEKITLDNNCLISLEKGERDSPEIRKIIDLHDSGVIKVFITAIAASENQRGGKKHRKFEEFEQYLRKIGCDSCFSLNPIAYLDIAYLDHCILSSSDLVDLEEQIHKILFPKMPFQYADFKKLYKTDPDVIHKKWLNAKCDVQAMWCHIHYNNDIFITNDGNFHKVSKKPGIIGLGAKEIDRPKEFIRRFNL
ncbi:MAG TPA: hypothetical protein G4O19_02560 [Dehalococcoidia bacterium]|nr:hypothetical protein [Dehalococcoidia bacterium]